MLPLDMTSRTHVSPAERKALSRLRQLLAEPGIVRGNLVEMRRRCGKNQCGCATDPEARHRSLYLGVSIEGRKRMIYIPAEWEERLRQWTGRYTEIRELLDQLSTEALRRLKEREG